jgi:cleavage stimulation factor subunit 3
VEEGDEGLKRRGAAVREPYDKLLDASYELIAKIKARETQDIARIEDASIIARQSTPSAGRGDDDDDEGNEADADAKHAAKEAQIRAIKDGNAVQTRLLSRTISFTWIALMRAMRRIQGKGKVNSDIGGSRQIFTDARRRGRLTSDVYVASALLEHHCYKDQAATKIFERGAKLFPDDEIFALEYLKHLIAINDITSKLLFGLVSHSSQLILCRCPSCFRDNSQQDVAEKCKAGICVLSSV